MDKTLVTFVNASVAPFVGVWGGEQMYFEAGQEVVMEQWRALHFAKHLVDSILNDRKVPTNNQSERDKLVSDIIKPVKAKEEKVEAPELPRGNGKPEPVKKGKGKKQKEFEDLDD